MEEKNPQQIQIRDNLAGGEYANAMQVSHSKEEFLLTFLNIAPPTGRVCGKIITNPGHLKRMIAALQDNLKMYEKNFGNVEPAASPKQDFGFKSE
ncbi:MAG: hypothetical protein A2744_03035 [Candidatus Buchananbacteria bacterium RIFCSPHIGHO2_01_FULL_44_11]|uniref:DUF3467 domain-containing protein n=1 Tax=Candidatus Buchananbacteria bacterium RIFCSPHIGHO2_01_FULL_44_11 TaxID=1797535 RepID=A0A1G1Y1C1_9BACT|nr:MAG: hypothetical protein A2744_03035 [Candidatus Buchananbacteria bacterium RIFCSPHIGHO2_01_FULL_44_11]